MNRLWVIESGMSVTGANADHRLAIRPSRAAEHRLCPGEDARGDGMVFPASGVEP